MMYRYYGLGACMLAIAGVAGAQSRSNWIDQHTLIVTASNTAANTLLVYNPAGTLLKQLPTDGQGGVSGNAGGIAQDHDRLAVVNFGSATVSVFTKDLEHSTLKLEEVIPAVASPVSVTFGDHHLYILSTTNVESHAIDAQAHPGVAANADGVAGLLHRSGNCPAS
jgi:hypothetical protein